MDNQLESSILNGDIIALKVHYDKVNSDVDFIINNDPYLKIQKKILKHSEQFYEPISDNKLKNELIDFSIKSQTALICGDSNNFGKYVFLQIESLISYGLFTKIGINKINLDLQDSSAQITLTINQKQFVKNIADHIFGWRLDKQIVTSISSKASIQEKDIQFTEKINLYFYYFIYLKQQRSYPDFDLTDVVKLIRDRSSHAQSKVVDKKKLIPQFESEFNSNHYQICNKFYSHINKFIKALI